MLTRWLTFTALLTGLANPQSTTAGQRSLAIAPTCRVKVHSEVELTLNCGDGKETGVVKHWHTPFGDLQTSGVHSELEPVFLNFDGSLVVPNSSSLHSGLYYCILQHTEGTTLWPYELNVGYSNQNSEGHGEYEQGSSCDTIRLRRNVGPEKENQPAVSDVQFAGAVAASVLVTFVLGFSTGALTRTYVLRCLGAITTKVRLSIQQHHQDDQLNHGCDTTITTLPPMHDNKAFEMRQVQGSIYMETTMSSNTSPPPAKPKRSFRHKREEHEETTAYLEGCDYVKEEERFLEENGQQSLEEISGGCEEKAEEKVETEIEVSRSYVLGEAGRSQTETEAKFIEDGEGKNGRESTESKSGWREEERAGEPENSSKEDGEESKIEEEKAREIKREEERWREGAEDGEKKGEEDIFRDSSPSSTDTEDEETGSQKLEDINARAKASPPPPCPARRSRVIRLYQYDEDGQRYCHLPDPPTDDPAPQPRLKQRSLSLTRLNSIMAAASAGTGERQEERRGQEREERPAFQMEI